MKTARGDVGHVAAAAIAVDRGEEREPVGILVAAQRDRCATGFGGSWGWSQRAVVRGL